MVRGLRIISTQQKPHVIIFRVEQGLTHLNLVKNLTYNWIASAKAAKWVGMFLEYTDLQKKEANKLKE